MPHPELSKPKFSQDLFATIDFAQPLDGYGSSIRNPRRETGARGLVPRRQCCCPAQLTHFTLAQTKFDQRTTHCMLRGCLPAGAIVTEIVHGGPVNDVLNAA